MILAETTLERMATFTGKPSGTGSTYHGAKSSTNRPARRRREKRERKGRKTGCCLPSDSFTVKF